MDEAHRQSRRTLLVLSDHFLASGNTRQEEWIARFVQDPDRLVLVKVGPIGDTGLLAPILYVDLTGCEEVEAERRLLEHVKLKTDPTFRAKPPKRPSFMRVFPERPPNPHFIGRRKGLSELQRLLKVFVSYAHEDEGLWKELDKHLGVLKHENLIEAWWDGQISPSSNWSEEIARRLEEADLILLLVSSDFLNSTYCYTNEMRRAIDRHEAGTAGVVPIILRPCLWRPAPFAKLQVLPRGARPVTSCAKGNKRDAVWAELATSIHQTAEKYATSRSVVPKAITLPAASHTMTSSDSQTKIFIIYSHLDIDWLKRLQVHIRPLVREGEIDLWDDTRLKADDKWRHEIKYALSASKVVIFLMSANFYASDFIATDELTALLYADTEFGTKLIPVLISASRFQRDKSLSTFQTINAMPLAELDQAQQEKVLDQVAVRIELLLMPLRADNDKDQAIKKCDKHLLQFQKYLDFLSEIDLKGKICDEDIRKIYIICEEVAAHWRRIQSDRFLTRGDDVGFAPTSHKVYKTGLRANLPTEMEKLVGSDSKIKIRNLIKKYQYDFRKLKEELMTERELIINLKE